VVTVDVASVLLAGLAGLGFVYAARQRGKLRNGASSGTRLSRRTWLVVLWVNAFVLVGDGGMLVYGFVTRQVMLGAQAHVLPLDDHVGMTQEVRGTAKNVPDGYSIWVVVRSRDSNRFYPQEPASVSSDGFWEDSVVFGNQSDSSKYFDVFVVLVDPLASAAFKNYLSEARGRTDGEGLRQLPNTIRVLDKVSVQRGP
jgi:hypothetical protein